RRGDVAVEPGALHAAIAARSTPLFPPSTGGGGSIQPANTRNAGAAGITAEQEWDVRDAGRRGKHRRPHTPPAGLDDEAGEVREMCSKPCAASVAAGAGCRTSQPIPASCPVSSSAH